MIIISILIDVAMRTVGGWLDKMVGQFHYHMIGPIFRYSKNNYRPLGMVVKHYRPLAPYVPHLQLLFAFYALKILLMMDLNEIMR